MTRKLFKNLFVFALAGMLLSGCHADVDLGQSSLSGDGEAQVNLSLPIGEIKTTFAEMIGLITQQDADVVINDKDIIELHLKKHYENEFHEIELTDYVGTVESDVTLQSVAPELVMLPAGQAVDVPFDMNILFSGVNDDIADERIDSMVIDLARFTTRISKSADLMISDNDIQKVEMHLGPMFRRAKGTVIALPGFRLDQDIPIEIDMFTLNMMKDETAEPSSSNVVNTATIQFVITLKTGENVVITPVSGFHFSFKVEMMSYLALYGYFEPGAQTLDSATIAIPLTTGEGSRTILPIANPEIKMKYTYGLSIPLDVNIGYIKAIHTDDSETLANWSGTTQPRLHLNNMLPIDAPLDAEVTDSSIILNSSSTNGQIDRFFEKEVSKIAYKYKMDVDKQREKDGKLIKQYRLTQDRKFALDFSCVLPFDFKAGLDVSFGDTIKDVSLSQASLDSLAAKSNGVIKDIEDAELYLYLRITNDIPVDLVMDAIFLDENNDEITELTQLHGVKIVGASMVNGLPADGELFTLAIPMKKEDFEKLAATHHIKIRVKVGDEQKPSVFYAHKELSIKLGVTANIKALIDLGALFVKK